MLFRHREQAKDPHLAREIIPDRVHPTLSETSDENRAPQDEMIYSATIIPLDGSPHLPENIRLWIGDSRGHWDGDTLVVDTTNFLVNRPRQDEPGWPSR